MHNGLLTVNWYEFVCLRPRFSWAKKNQKKREYIQPYRDRRFFILSSSSTRTLFTVQKKINTNPRLILVHSLRKRKRQDTSASANPCCRKPLHFQPRHLHSRPRLNTTTAGLISNWRTNHIVFVHLFIYYILYYNMLSKYFC